MEQEYGIIYQNVFHLQTSISKFMRKFVCACFYVFYRWSRKYRNNTIWRPVGRRFRRLNSLQLNRGFMVPVFFPDTFLSMKDFMKVTLWKPYKVTIRMFF